MGFQRRHRPRVEGPSPGGIQEEKAQQAVVVEERQRQRGAPALGQQPAAVVRGRIQLPLEVMEHPGLPLIPQPAEGGNGGEGARFKVGLARSGLAIPARWPAVRARFAGGREQVGAGFVMHEGDPGDPQGRGPPAGAARSAAAPPMAAAESAGLAGGTKLPTTSTAGAIVTVSLPPEVWDGAAGGDRGDRSWRGALPRRPARPGRARCGLGGPGRTGLEAVGALGTLEPWRPQSSTLNTSPCAVMAPRWWRT